MTRTAVPKNKDLTKIDKWCTKMESFTDDKSFSSHRSAVMAHCPRGKLYFCDGRVNISLKKAHGIEPIEVCEYYINGSCAEKSINH